MTRHEARRQAFLLLFAYSLSQTPVKELIDLAEEAGTLLPEDTAQDLPPQPVDDFAARIAAGVEEVCKRLVAAAHHEGLPYAFAAVPV